MILSDIRVGADCRVALSYPYEGDAEHANVIFWLIGQSVTGRVGGVYYQFVRYQGDPAQNAACYEILQELLWC